MTLIALMLPGQGSLTDWWRNLAVPFFGTGRWLLPFVLLLSGWYVEWGPGKEPGAPWGRTLLGHRHGLRRASWACMQLIQLLAASSRAAASGAFLAGLLRAAADDARARS